MSEPTLDAKSLGLSRGPKRLFANLSFAVGSGEALILRGPNGVGKTSLLRVLAGLTVADEGQVQIDGKPINPLSAVGRNAMLYAGHANGLKDDFTALENLTDQLALDANPASESARLDAMRRVGLGDRCDVAARRLSQGQKRRVGLARLVANAGQGQKSIWLLDEPTNALDDDGSALFRQIVSVHLASGGIAVIATHLPMALTGQVTELQMQEVS